MIFSAELLVQTVLSGLMVGVLYALMALGITFIYSIVKTINGSVYRCRSSASSEEPVGPKQSA